MNSKQRRTALRLPRKEIIVDFDPVISPQFKHGERMGQEELIRRAGFDSGLPFSRRYTMNDYTL